MSKALLSTGASGKFFVTIQSWIENRINNTLSLQLIENQVNDFFIVGVFFLVVLLTIWHIKKGGKYKHLYALFLFYYFGYMCMSFFNKGILLFHYMYLVMPLTYLWLASFLRGKYVLLFLPLIGSIYLANLNYTKAYLDRDLTARMGKHQDSWTALSHVASEVIDMQKGKEFGYFVFSPDALAYQPRYAMIYHFKAADAKAFEYVKKPTTYIIANPPPTNNPYMTHVWWRKNSVNIASEPAQIKKLPGGFTIEKLNLNEEEQKIPHAKTIELGIHFR